LITGKENIKLARIGGFHLWFTIAERNEYRLQSMTFQDIGTF
jgi:hypothetical protein